MTTKTMDGDIYLDNLESSELPTNLIEKALALIQEHDGTDTIFSEYEFCIEKFGWYLLSPEFIEKYMSFLLPFEITSYYEGYLRHTAMNFGVAIYEYQKGNPEPLISLLERIG